MWSIVEPVTGVDKGWVKAADDEVGEVFSEFLPRHIEGTIIMLMVIIVLISQAWGPFFRLK